MQKIPRKGAKTICAVSEFSEENGFSDLQIAEIYFNGLTLHILELILSCILELCSASDHKTRSVHVYTIGSIGHVCLQQAIIWVLVPLKTTCADRTQVQRLQPWKSLCDQLKKISSAVLKAIQNVYMVKVKTIHESSTIYIIHKKIYFSGLKQKNALEATQWKKQLSHTDMELSGATF